ncbi:MAG: hypothetical protein C4346_02725 [Chloroflexota bacterium]
MRKRLGSIWLVAIILATMSGCGSTRESGLRSEDWATIGAYHRDVQSLKTQVATLLTAVPTPVPATPVPPFGEAWRLEILEIRIASSFPNYSSDADQGLMIEARGQFLAIRMHVTNASRAPVPRFPWWNLRLRDSQGRIFTPHRDATTSFVVAETTIREQRPEEYQPGLPYEEAVVFDVPLDQDNFTLVSADDTFALTLPALSGTPQAGQ